MKGLDFLMFVLIPISIGAKFATITIEVPNEAPIVWEECVYRRIEILHAATRLEKIKSARQTNLTEDCIECAFNGTDLAQFDKPTKEKYKDCTRSCGKPTMCTFHWYNSDGAERPECFQCEPLMDEDVTFGFKKVSEMCPLECRECAVKVDFATAQDCVTACAGRPTFCYPHDIKWFSQKVCFQSSKAYGCAFKEFEPEVDSNCKKCADLFEKRDADECAYDCIGKPAYHEVIGEAEGGQGLSSKRYFICDLGSDIYGDVFLPDIPDKILRFIKENNSKLWDL